MSTVHYSVLKAHAVSGMVVSGSSAHYRVTVDATDTAGQPLTAAINIQSVDGSEVLFVLKSAFIPPDPAGLASLQVGLTGLQSEPGGLALDFVREQIGGQPMVTRDEMTLLPIASNAILFVEDAKSKHASEIDRSGHALQNAVTALLSEAIADPASVLYVFGSAFADAGVTDGIHDIHMNQGNPVNSHSNENGAWQDGAVFVQFPATESWTALFLAFQTESWQTNGNGNPA